MKTVIEMDNLMLPLLPEGIAYFVEYGGEVYSSDQMREYAKKVAEDVKEACAKLCDKQADSAYWEGANACADAIRDRGNT